MSEDGSNNRRGRGASRHGKMNRKEKPGARSVINFANPDEMENNAGIEYGEDFVGIEYGPAGAEAGYIEYSEVEYIQEDTDGEYGQESFESGYMEGYAGADYIQEGMNAGDREEQTGFYYEGNGAGMGYEGGCADAEYEEGGAGIGYEGDYAGAGYEEGGAGIGYEGDYAGAGYEENGVETGYAQDYVENGFGVVYEEEDIGGSYGENAVGVEEEFAGNEYGEYFSGGYEQDYVGEEDYVGAEDEAGADELEYDPEAEYIEEDEGGGYEEDGRKKRRIRWIGAAALCAAILIGIRIYIDSLAYKICRVEAGVMASPSDFLKNPDEDAVFAEDSQPFDIAEPGEYAVKVKSGLFTHKCTLIIQDTIPPKGQAVRRQVDLGAVCGAEEFVENIEDATEVTVSYLEEPDFTKVGSQSVEVVLTDKGNNRTILEAEMFVTAVMGNVTVEAGEGCPGLDSFVIAAKEASFVTDISGWDYSRTADHEVVLNVDGQQYTSILHVVDTVPPKVEVHDIEGYALQSRNAEDFITSVKDVTEVTAAFEEAPDLSLIGTQEVTLVFTDEGGNETVKTAELTLREDTEPPVIHGAKDISIYVGESVSYRKNVYADDNCPEGVTLTVDNQGVNLNEAGVYPVTYRAEDLAGNTSAVTIHLTVRKNEYDVNEVNAMADKVLADIIKPEMSQWDKAEAIYKYVSKHITYVSSSVKGNWIRAAWEGLSDKKGDCYVFACTAKVLLTRADITNMDIAKITPTSEHYWSLVDVGDGWYHYDTTPRKDHTTFFMWTDEELMAYSDSHNDSHKYDHSLYPEVN